MSSPRRPRTLRVCSLALAFGLVLAFVPMPTMTFASVAVLDRLPLPALDEVGAQELDELQAASEEPIGDERLVGTETDLDPFTAVGVMFDEAPTDAVLVRTRAADGTWADWRELEFEVDEGPDANTAEADVSGYGTEPIWVEDADGYELSIGAADVGTAEVAMVREEEQRALVDAVPLADAAAAVPAPFEIRTRGQWGARPASTSAGSTVRLAVVHHSASSNSYTPAQVPSVLRSIQAFHMDGRGWSDIAYNFVVDKYGGLWEGRAGSIDAPIIGAHAMGFNTNAVGVMVIGDHTQVGPTTVSLESVSRVIGWKLALHGVDPTGRVDFTSGGSTTIPAGRTVNLSRVIGHLEVGATSCPGSIQNSLGNIRNRAQDWTNWTRAISTPVGSVDAVGVGPGSVTAVGWAADPDATAPMRVQLRVGGVETEATAGGYRPDVAAIVPFAGDNSGFQVTATGVPPGYQDMCVTAINQNYGLGNLTMLCRPVIVPDPTGRAVNGSIGFTSASVGRIVVAGSVNGPGRNGASQIGLEVDGTVRKWILPDGNDNFSNTVEGVLGGTRRVCVIGRSALGGPDTRFDCRLVEVAGASPIGSVDKIAHENGAILVAGWTLDLETVDPTIVGVVLNGQRYSTLANGYRPDVGRTYPGYGDNHGFFATYPVGPGSHSVCVEFGGVGQGPNVVGRCETVVVK